MPHLFTNRPRISDLTRGGKPNVRADFRWETANAVIYKAGGALFVVGSVLFFPYFEEYQDIGCWLFFVGSLLYLIVTGHDMAEVRLFWGRNRLHSPRERLDYLAAWSYLTGTLLFTFGSLFFLSWWGWFTIAAWCFVIGSVLFVLGASLNVLEIVHQSSLVSLQLTNLTAITFVVGSILFVVASIPYLWTFHCATDRYIVFNFLAWQYLAGSLLFLLGGVFNYYRAYLLMRNRLAGMESDPRADARMLAFMRGEIDADEYRELERQAMPGRQRWHR